MLKPEGTLWLNMGDTYCTAGGKRDRAKYGTGLNGSTTNEDAQGDLRARQQGLQNKDLLGIPWRLAFALQASGWILRQDIIWHKTNAMPESVRDRCVKAHEHIFLFAKQPKYYFNHEAIQERAIGNLSGNAGHKYEGTSDPKHATKTGLARYSFRRDESKRAQQIVGQSSGTHRPDRQDIAYADVRTKRSVWPVATRPYAGSHFATYPEELITPCVLAGCPVGGIVLDPFMGAGTTAVACIRNQRHFIGIEPNAENISQAYQRFNGIQINMAL